MSVTSEITRLQNAKADLKTAIEGKGVTVPSNTKLDGYADLVDSIETGGGGGGTTPYIVNPLNGADLGNSSRNGGTYQHQYQISNGSIINARLFKFTFSNQYTKVDNTIAESSNYKEVEFINSHGRYGSVLQITTNGLLSLILSQISQNWQKEYNPYGVILTTDNNVNLIDYFTPYVWWTCFIKDTNIILVNRAEKKIQDITYDDELLVWNFDEGKYDSAKPLWIKKAQTTTWYYRLTFSDGTVLKVTGDYPKAHSLYSVDDGKFIHANELVGKKVYTLNGIQTLEKCEEMHEEVEFYNIITDYHMNLFAEGILTSTSLNNLYPIEKMIFIKEDRKPVFDMSIFEDKWVKGLRLNEQPNDVTDYVNNVIRLAND